eukprot:9911057-Prorocentrum_lima.AAC.1
MHNMERKTIEVDQLEQYLEVNATTQPTPLPSPVTPQPPTPLPVPEVLGAPDDHGHIHQRGPQEDPQPGAWPPGL